MFHKVLNTPLKPVNHQPTRTKEGHSSPLIGNFKTTFTEFLAAVKY